MVPYSQEVSTVNEEHHWKVGSGLEERGRGSRREGGREGEREGRGREGGREGERVGGEGGGERVGGRGRMYIKSYSEL